MSETFKPKCYVFVCAECGLLAHSERSDALTCSTACRVKAHRNGTLKRIRKINEDLDLPTGFTQRQAAIKKLAPDMHQELVSGTRKKVDAEVQQAVWEAYWKIVRQTFKP